MGALLALVPFRDWIYGALIAVALTWGGWTYHKYEVAVTYAANAQAETAQVQAAAKEAIANKVQDYNATLVANKVITDAQLKAAAAQSADLSQRLRNYQAARCPSPVLGSAAPATAGAVASPSSVDEAIAGVIAAAAHDNAVIEAERAERDSLTGR